MPGVPTKTSHGSSRKKFNPHFLHRWCGGDDNTPAEAAASKPQMITSLPFFQMAPHIVICDMFCIAAPSG